MPQYIRILLSMFALFGILLVRAQAAPAGVIIWQEATGPNRPEYLITIIQGHKEWLALAPAPQDISHVMSAAVDDLDAGVRTTIYYRDKIYFVEKPFPTPVEDMNPIYTGELKPNGKFQKIAGYSCEEYWGSGESTHWGYSTELDCFSKVAPGVAEYNQFMALLNRRYRDAGYINASWGNNFPGFGYPEGMTGILLESVFDGGPGRVAVTKIESRAVPATQFEIPAGFVRMRHTVRHQR